MLNTDEKTFEKLFREHYTLLCNYASSMVCNELVVEDIVQNFFISIWEKKHLSVTEETFLPYAYRSIKNSCINYYKSEAAKENFFAQLADEWQLQMEEEEESIHKQEVHAALRKLPEKCRKVFLLKCVTGLRYKEIAEISDITVNTVKYHIGEAFRIMREELKDLMILLILIFS